MLPVSDDGGSTAEIVRVLGVPAVGDIRSRCLRLADDTSAEVGTGGNHVRSACQSCLVTELCSRGDAAAMHACSQLAVWKAVCKLLACRLSSEPIVEG